MLFTIFPLYDEKGRDAETLSLRSLPTAPRTGLGGGKPPPCGYDRGLPTLYAALPWSVYLTGDGGLSVTDEHRWPVENRQEPVGVILPLSAIPSMTL
jgi:hypothetical protein